MKALQIKVSTAYIRAVNQGAHTELSTPSIFQAFAYLLNSKPSHLPNSQHNAANKCEL